MDNQEFERRIERAFAKAIEDERKYTCRIDVYDYEKIKKHLRDYRRFVQSKSVDDEIKRLIGE